MRPRREPEAWGGADPGCEPGVSGSRFTEDPGLAPGVSGSRFTEDPGLAPGVSGSRFTEDPGLAPGVSGSRFTEVFRVDVRALLHAHRVQCHALWQLRGESFPDVHGQGLTGGETAAVRELGQRLVDAAPVEAP